jgi:hypothetical protein
VTRYSKIIRAGGVAELFGHNPKRELDYEFVGAVLGMAKEAGRTFAFDHRSTAHNIEFEQLCRSARRFDLPQTGDRLRQIVEVDL